MQSEAVLTKKLCEQMGNIHRVCIHPICGGMYGQSGWPDRLIISDRFFGYVEFKAGRNPLTKLQTYLHKQINACRPRTAFVCRFAESDCGRNVVCLIEYYDGTEPRGGTIVGRCGFAGPEVIDLLGQLQKFL